MSDLLEILELQGGGVANALRAIYRESAPMIYRRRGNASRSKRVISLCTAPRYAARKTCRGSLDEALLVVPRRSRSGFALADGVQRPILDSFSQQRQYARHDGMGV